MDDLLAKPVSLFTAAECQTIVNMFLESKREPDVRSIENLPGMPSDYGVARVNRWDEDGRMLRSGRLDWVYERLLPLVGARRRDVAFTLLHEFDEAHDRFDWHVDTKPNDGKSRTTNLNVMLSEPRVDFGGGALQVGSHNVSVRRGDAYAYAAAAPHVVHPLAWGLRRTLVVALNTAADDDRAEYFREAEERYTALAEGALRHEPKLHLLRGEFFEALGRADDAKRAFCASYRATDDAGAYARRFLADGRDAAVADRMEVANEYFRMARCIEPDLLSDDALAAELAVGGAATRLYAAPGDDVLAECAALRADADAVARATPPGGGRRRCRGRAARRPPTSLSPSATSRSPRASCPTTRRRPRRCACARGARKLNFTSSRHARAASPPDEPQRHSSTPASD